MGGSGGGPRHTHTHTQACEQHSLNAHTRVHPRATQGHWAEFNTQHPQPLPRSKAKGGGKAVPPQPPTPQPPHMSPTPCRTSLSRCTSACKAPSSTPCSRRSACRPSMNRRCSSRASCNCSCRGKVERGVGWSAHQNLHRLACPSPTLPHNLPRHDRTHQKPCAHQPVGCEFGGWPG